jgi:uncharacterized membrane protein
MAIQHIGQAQQQSPHAMLKFKYALERGMNAFGRFLDNYWPHILTTVTGLVVAAAFSVPVLSYFGLDAIAKPIFYSMHYICAQVPAHSFYIFGHQLGLCARNLSIYTSMFVGCLVFTLSKKRLPGIPWWLWAILILPMAWDGGTQMFGWRESSWELRVITGTLFGLADVWFVLPLIQKTLLETAMYTYTTTPTPTMAMYPTFQQYPQQTAFVMPAAHADALTAPMAGENTVAGVTSSVEVKNEHGMQEKNTTGVGTTEQPIHEIPL